MKNKSYLIIAVATLIAFTVAGTYAFFQILGGNTEERNVSVQTYTSDSLSFNVTKDIEIEASRENFYQNAGNLSDTTTATARLVPNSRTNTATEHYNVYVVIDSNNFVYTTEAHTPELLLTISSPSGTINSITGLNNVSNGVFDITTRTGAFLVAEDYEISASAAAGTTQSWTMTVTLVNLNTDQNNNTGKTLTGTIYMTKEDLTTYSLAELNTLKTTRTVNNEEVSTIGSTTATVEIEATAGSESIGTYYFGIEEQSSTGYIPVTSKIVNGIEFFESNVPAYTFTNLKDNTDYIIYAFVEDQSGFKSNIYETTIKTNNYVLPSVTNVTTEVLDLHRIKLTATSSAGENQVSKYLFDCGSGWSEAQDSNEYICTGLTYNTNYTFKVKVLDTYGKYSVDYDKPSIIENYQIACSAGTYLAANEESCAACPAGSYCPGGTYIYDELAHGATACSQGSYSNSGASSCTACSGGTTNSGTGNTTSCTTTCSNNANVASWKTPTWSANSVSDLCAAATCSSNSYIVSGNDCIASTIYAYWNKSNNNGTLAVNAFPTSYSTSYTDKGSIAAMIKTTKTSSGAVSHQVCLYNSSKTNPLFCMSQNYGKNANLGTVRNNIASGMGVSTSLCSIEYGDTSAENYAFCRVSSGSQIHCYAYYGGTIGCYDGVNHCGMNTNGNTYCG